MEGGRGSVGSSVGRFGKEGSLEVRGCILLYTKIKKHRTIDVPHPESSFFLQPKVRLQKEPGISCFSSGRCFHVLGDSGNGQRDVSSVSSRSSLRQFVKRMGLDIGLGSLCVGSVSCSCVDQLH